MKEICRQSSWNRGLNLQWLLSRNRSSKETQAWSISKAKTIPGSSIQSSTPHLVTHPLICLQSPAETKTYLYLARLHLNVLRSKVKINKKPLKWFWNHWQDRLAKSTTSMLPRTRSEIWKMRSLSAWTCLSASTSLMSKCFKTQNKWQTTTWNLKNVKSLKDLN